MRIGMFATATFYGRTAQIRATVPATAVLHLHDREWVYVPVNRDHFKRLEVQTGNMLPDGQQEIISGLQAGANVVQNALVFQNTVEQ
jgi:cobalt-zinc-cadmium efflux system membrane fusion protein